MVFEKTDDFRSLFLLDKSIHFLNHGSFGACPIPVFECYQEWQVRLEKQPVKFLGRDYPELDFKARQHLADFLGTVPGNICFIPNATTGVNIIARSLHLNPGDEILSTDHEYGACEFAWEYACHQTGARYLRTQVRLPISSDEDFLKDFLSSITSKTKVIFISHITSPTAVYFPVEKICKVAREKGILTVIDGAHAPGQIDLELDHLGADFYIGNCHKWMLSPKGAGFLYANHSVQHLVQPLIVSWGLHPLESNSTGSQFQDYLQWTGTRDPAAYLTVPSAIDFMKSHNWSRVRDNCHHLLVQTILSIKELFQDRYYVPPSNNYYQMGIVQIPSKFSSATIKSRLYDEFSVEIPLIEWNGDLYLRISIQAYNSREDCQALIKALEIIFSL